MNEIDGGFGGLVVGVVMVKRPVVVVVGSEFEFEFESEKFDARRIGRMSVLTPVIGSIEIGDETGRSDIDFGLDLLIKSPGVAGIDGPSRSSVMSSVPSCMYNPRRDDRCLRLCGVTGTDEACAAAATATAAASAAAAAAAEAAF